MKSKGKSRMKVSSGLMTGSVYIANQLVTENATIVEVEVTIPGRTSRSRGIGVTLPVFVGTSKKHPDDTFDEQIGYELALGRALRDAGRKLIHDGNEKSRKASRGRRAQQPAKAAPLATHEMRDALLQQLAAFPDVKVVYEPTSGTNTMQRV